MAKHDFEQKAKCTDCGGTGLYVGLAERDGAAVVCYVCKGTGCKTIKITWKDFEGRIPRREIKRVYEVNPGIVIGGGQGGEFRLGDFGGMPYAAWASGKPFPAKSENRKFTCPAWWYQSADYDKRPKWKECIGCGSFYDCEHFGNKEKCWERFDKEALEK